MLSDRSAALWRAVLADYELAPAELELLSEACTALDRADEARAVIATDGAVVVDRYGSPKAHPACDIEGRARAFYAAAIRQLKIGLDDAPASLRSGGKPGPRPKTQRQAANR